MLETSLFAALLLGIAALLAWSHLREWRQAREETTRDEEQLDYQWRQFRRRMQTTAMLALVALLLPIAPWIRAPGTMALYVLVLVVLVLWMTVLAGADFVAGRRRLTRLQDDLRIERAKAAHRLRQQRKEH